MALKRNRFEPQALAYISYRSMKVILADQRRTTTTYLDPSAPRFDGVAETVKLLCDVRSRTSDQLFLQFAVDALKVTQFNLHSDDCLRLLDKASLNRLHLEHHLIQTRICALQISIVV